MVFLSSAYWMFLSYPLTVFITLLGTVTLTAAVYLKSLFMSKSCLPKLYYKESSLTKSILQKCQTMQTLFRPSFWIRNAHTQTVLGMSSCTNELQLSRKYIQMKDAGVVSLSEMIRVIATGEFLPMVLVVPDVTGSKRIVAGIFQEANVNHYRPVLFNGRGQNGNQLTTAKILAYGDPSDLREVIQYLTFMYPSVKLSAVGIGSGADLVMSYLGEYGSSSHLQSAVCISSTYFPETVYCKKCPSFYEMIHLTYLKSVIGRYMKDFSPWLDIGTVMKTWTMNKFIENVFCKMSEHSNNEEYWENNGPLRDVDEISTPVLCVNSLDDPLCSRDTIPYDIFSDSPNLFLVTTDYGGHGGFLEGPFSKSWIAKTSMEYIKTFLEFQVVENGHSRS